ncbi:serine/threonine-protein kinase [Pseudofrankia saprophytica]|uniref:serine/threonine-protein kinase n=1 Tax=Pseudofrankia saprophytica TaxID=298655 RepID=UPI000234BC47|nr:serine/threonine-protein kinase [Pseudofrankia saprophytica]
MIDGYSSFERVGGGGFSTVYRAYQEVFDRQVAVKVLHADLHDDDARRRFLRECRATGRLTGHPHIVTVFDAGTTRENRPYLAMEYFPGGSLGDSLRARGPLPVATAASLMLPIADALATAHQAGILHRDLKPANILLRGPADPVLSDFGIAGVFDAESAATMSTAYTPGYAAPEVLSGDQLGPAVDLFAFGATLFALLTAGPPFPGKLVFQVLPRILAGDMAPLDSPDLPPDGAALVRSLLAADPRQRPSWEEVSARLVPLTGIDGSGGAAVAGRVPLADPSGPRPTRPEVDPSGVDPSAAGWTGGATRRRALSLVLPAVAVAALAALVAVLVMRPWTDGGDVPAGGGVTDSPAEAAAKNGGNGPSAATASPPTSPSASPPATASAGEACARSAVTTIDYLGRSWTSRYGLPEHCRLGGLRERQHQRRAARRLRLYECRQPGVGDLPVPGPRQPDDPGRHQHLVALHQGRRRP